jgi:hypothetical protein
MADLENATSNDGQAATQDTGPAAVQDTVQSGGDAAGQSAPTDEGFGKIDPKTLPPELRKAYDSMLTDYKQKTTKVSETVKAEVAKATEAFKAKADFYDQLAGQESFVKQWNEYVKTANGQQNAQPDNPVMAELQEIKAKIQEREVAEVINAFSEAVDEKGAKMHPDFDKLNGVIVGKNDQVGEYSLLRACIELSPGNSPDEKLAAGYKTAKQLFDQIFEDGKKAGMGQMRMKVQRSTEPPSGSSVNTNVTDKKPKNAHEAFEMARQGIAVQR